MSRLLLLNHYLTEEEIITAIECNIVFQIKGRHANIILKGLMKNVEG